MAAPARGSDRDFSAHPRPRAPHVSAAASCVPWGCRRPCALSCLRGEWEWDAPWRLAVCARGPSEAGSGFALGSVLLHPGGSEPIFCRISQNQQD